MGRRSKIAYKVLQNDKRDGGLNLVNLENKDKSLKATWPMILAHEPEYASMVYSMLRCSRLGEDLWRCNLKKDDVKFINSKNLFWKQVLNSWCEYNYYVNRNFENQLLWFNSDIRIRGRPFFWADIYDRGLRYVCQLFVDCKLKSYERMSQEYGLSMLRYNSIVVALSQDHKDFFTKNKSELYMPIRPHNYDTIVLGHQKGFSSKVYRFLSEDVKILHNKYIKWREELGEDMTESLVEYGLKYKDIFRVTNITKYRSFQYRLLGRGIVTNIQLHKWGIIDSSICRLCKEQEESVMHAMFGCKEIRDIWDQLVNHFQGRFPGLVVKINATNILFNEICDPKKHVVNFMCLIAKQYIYRCRCLGEKPTLIALVAQIRSVENVEKFIAKKNNKLHVHERNWNVSKVANQNINLNEYVETYLHMVAN